MAKTVTPDFGPMKVTERAEWFYGQLAKQPGRIVRRAHSKGGPMQTWRRLEVSNLIDLMAEIGPGLSVDQYRLINGHLVGLHEDVRRRDSVPVGAGRYEHYILVEDDAVDIDAPVSGPEQASPAAAPAPEQPERPDEPMSQQPLPLLDDEEPLDEAALAERTLQVIASLQEENKQLREAAEAQEQRIASLERENAKLRDYIERRSQAMQELDRVVRQFS